tara:strand:- start:188 stop:484 length:297 start_codon:yes stop_codon:yes gene_type:complete
MFSCNDLKKISNQLETIKGNQDIIIAKQKETDAKLVLLEKTTLAAAKQQAAPSKNNKQNNKKRKTPNPDFVHNIDIAGSVVLGNPDAKVTITKFTDFQ